VYKKIYDKKIENTKTFLVLTTVHSDISTTYLEGSCAKKVDTARPDVARKSGFLTNKEQGFILIRNTVLLVSHSTNVFLPQHWLEVRRVFKLRMTFTRY